MSLSLVAVFLPLLLMGGLPGRLLREFAVTLSVAIGISLAVSLTLTPMMCGWLLKSGKPHQPTRNRGFGRLLVAVQGGYGKSLKWVLKHSRLTGLVVLGTIALSVWLYISIENLLPGAGHRGADGRHSGRPEHLLPGDARQAAGLYEDHSRRSGGG